MALVKENAHAEFTQTVRIEKLPTISAPTGTTTTLTKNDSGKVVLVAPNAALVVLPAPVVGLNFIFVSTGAYATAASTITTDAATSLLVGGSSAKNGGDCDKPGGSDDKISFTTDTEAGDYVELVCISTTQWFCRGLAAGSATTAYSSTD